jgi:hypothetical protein
MSMGFVVVISTAVLVYQFVSGSLAGDESDSVEG